MSIESVMSTWNEALNVHNGPAGAHLHPWACPILFFILCFSCLTQSDASHICPHSEAKDFVML